MITAFINGEQVTSYQDASPMLSGRVKISNNWHQVYYDNLLIEKIAGGCAYALSMVDGQDDSVSYEGSWTIDNPGSGSADNGDTGNTTPGKGAGNAAARSTKG